jgi:hypothetical protein
MDISASSVFSVYRKPFASLRFITNPHKNNLRSQNGNAGYGINDIA